MNTIFRASLTLTLSLFFISAPALAEPKTQTVTLAIQGMVTRSCPALVRTALGRLKGVHRVQANLQTQLAEVEYASTEIQPPAMVEVLKDQVGFDAVVVHTVRFAIVGIVTKNCPVLVKTALRKVNGILGVDASLESKTVEVTYLEDQTSPAAIQALIKDQVGFESKRLP